MEASEILRTIIENEGITYSALSKKMGLNRAQPLYDIRDGKVKRISTNYADKILLAFPRYDKAWLLSGEGEPFGRERNDEAAPRVIEFENFPFVSQKAYAGYLSGWADEEYVESLPTVAFPVDHTPSGKYLVFEVKGDSMDDGTYDSYLEGDLLLCRQIGIHLWAGSKLHFKRWDFVIVHEEGVIVKRIVDHDVENHTITIHSLNPDKKRFPDRVIDLCEVRQILNVVSMMRPRKR
mgnify:CR=1 FL=1